MSLWTYNRGMAYPFIQALAASDMSGSAALRFLQEIGLGYRRTDFFADWRRAQHIGIKKSLVIGLDSGDVVPRSWMAETPAERWNIPKIYKGEFEVSLFNPETGESRTKWYSVGFESETLKGDALGYAVGTIPWKVYHPDEEVTGVELVGWSHLEGAAY